MDWHGDLLGSTRYWPALLTACPCGWKLEDDLFLFRGHLFFFLGGCIDQRSILLIINSRCFSLCISFWLDVWSISKKNQWVLALPNKILFVGHALSSVTNSTYLMPCWEISLSDILEKRNPINHLTYGASEYIRSAKYQRKNAPPKTLTCNTPTKNNSGMVSAQFWISAYYLVMFYILSILQLYSLCLKHKYIHTIPCIKNKVIQAVTFPSTQTSLLKHPPVQGRASSGSMVRQAEAAK